MTTKRNFKSTDCINVVFISTCVTILENVLWLQVNRNISST